MDNIDSVTNYVDLHGCISKSIADKKPVIISVNDDDGDMGRNFTYTVGMHSLKLPELIMTGLHVKVMQKYIMMVSDKLMRGEIKPTSQLLKDIIEPKCEGCHDLSLKEICTQRQLLQEDYAIQLFEYYRNMSGGIRMMQLRWPDGNGYMQGTKGAQHGNAVTFIGRH